MDQASFTKKLTRHDRIDESLKQMIRISYSHRSVYSLQSLVKVEKRTLASKYYVLCLDSSYAVLTRASSVGGTVAPMNSSKSSISLGSNEWTKRLDSASEVRLEF